MALVPMQLADVPEVARVHSEALRGDFLPSLGQRFLRALYRAAVVRELGSGWIWVEDGHVFGLVLGCLDTRAFFRGVLTVAAPELAMAALPVVLRHPAMVRRVAETFAYPGREILPSVSAELLVLAVEEPARRRGIGQRLVEVLNDYFRGHGIRAYKLTVLKLNSPANRFYQDLGFQLAGQFVLYQGDWNLYQYSLAPQTL